MEVPATALDDTEASDPAAPSPDCPVEVVPTDDEAIFAALARKYQLPVPEMEEPSDRMLSPELETLAELSSEAAQLGSLQAQYLPYWQPWRVMLYSALGLLVAALGSAGIVLAVRANLHAGHVLGWLILLSFVGFATPFYALIQGQHARALRALVLARGLVHIEDVTIQTCGWDQIEVIWHEVIQRHYMGFHALEYTDHTFRVRRQDGTVLTLTSRLDKVAVLGDLLQREAMKYLLPQAIAALCAGRMVECGAFRVTRTGLHHGKRQLAWDEIRDVAIRSKQLFVDLVGAPLKPSIRVALGTVANPTLLVELFQAIKAQRAAD
jgi:hypothetical protein